MICMLQ